MATPEDIRGHYVKVNGTRTFYDELGEGQPLICIHTAGASSLEYQYILPLYAEMGFHAYALDLPGHSIGCWRCSGGDSFKCIGEFKRGLGQTTCLDQVTFDMDLGAHLTDGFQVRVIIKVTFARKG